MASDADCAKDEIETKQVLSMHTLNHL